ncbi:MAG: bifunctional 5,10-methylenetetrahydrofolate dehydrogenase/5,10-methenyltetrahydrofolate cyclohydrolase [bacterium]|nr:bifunctional 5,10-methylenetetrahydrofolate dehydrogenase/5,10-methenyltetrahydrofolate cyclohydrolase [bacterium]
MTLILDGRKARDELAKRLKAGLKRLPAKPVLAIVQAGDLAESNAYIERKKKFGEELGISVLHIKVAPSGGEEKVLEKVSELNQKTEISGIIVQLPLPPDFNKKKIANRVSVKKDVDGLSDANFQKLKAGDSGAIIPATARGVLELLEFYYISVAGKKVAVLGRSRLVGAPIAEVLKQKGAEVFVCHSETTNTAEITRSADLVISAVGKPKFLGTEFFRDDRTQVVVDVGITAVTEKGAEKLEEEMPKRTLVGDVDFKKVKDMVYAISPVPGGVGPMTVLALFENLLEPISNLTSE